MDASTRAARLGQANCAWAGFKEPRPYKVLKVRKRNNLDVLDGFIKMSFHFLAKVKARKCSLPYCSGASLALSPSVLNHR